MQIYELIKKKRNKGELTRDELSFLISGYVKGEVPDYQISAFLMSVYFNGMSDRETFDYTDLLYHSGSTIDLSILGKISVDKHSTGGVGDKVSIPLVPLVAAAGIPVPMISGRGLGHTGGTLDKLESIPGFRVNLTVSEFLKFLKANNMAMMGQTADIVPADKKLYALRDVTGTIESLPMIVGSILSKKLAEGTNGIVFDVKTGSGAFMQKKVDAIRLAESLVKMARRFKRNAVALVTDMDQPLGNAIGNALEIQESIDLLNGKGPKDLEEITIELGSYMLVLGKVAKSLREARKKLKGYIEDGKGISWFKKMVSAQGGDPSIVDNPSKLPQAKYQLEIKSKKTGYIHGLDALTLGQASVQLGAGRERMDSIIDPAVGIMLSKKRGDKVTKGEILAIVHHNNPRKLDNITQKINSAYFIKSAKPRPSSLILKVIKQ